MKPPAAPQARSLPPLRWYLFFLFFRRQAGSQFLFLGISKSPSEDSVARRQMDVRFLDVTPFPFVGVQEDAVSFQKEPPFPFSPYKLLHRLFILNGRVAFSLLCLTPFVFSAEKGDGPPLLPTPFPKLQRLPPLEDRLVGYPPSRRKLFFTPCGSLLPQSRGISAERCLLASPSFFFSAKSLLFLTAFR